MILMVNGTLGEERVLAPTDANIKYSRRVVLRFIHEQMQAFFLPSTENFFGDIKVCIRRRLGVKLVIESCNWM